MKRVKTNLIILLLAILLSTTLFYFFENSDFFSASVLLLKDFETMEANARDVGYKNEKNILDVFVSNSLENINYITLSIVYDEDEIFLNLDKIVSQVDYELISNISGNVLIKFTNFSNFDYGQSLFELDFIGEKPSILLSEGIAVLTNGNTKNLSIGLLNIVSQDYYHGVLSKN